MGSHFAVANPGVDVERSWSTRTGGSTYLHHPQPQTPPIPSPSPPSTASGAPDISTMAAEMVALRAQVARLEGERLEREGVPPPAYD